MYACVTICSLVIIRPNLGLWLVAEDTELDSHRSIKASSLFRRFHCMYQIFLWRTKYKKFVCVQKGGRE